jgi:hypothetical protein
MIPSMRGGPKLTSQATTQPYFKKSVVSDNSVYTTVSCHYRYNYMRNFSLKYFHFTIALLIVIQKPLFSQVPDFSKVPTLYEGDSLNITYLINNGVKITNGKVIAWFPKDSLSEKKMNEITDLLNAGISGAEKFINAPLPWQVHQPNEPYTFYFRFDRFVSHASHAGFVSIPFWRIKDAKAPWLHEAVHEMLDTKTGSWSGPDVTDKDQEDNMPLWLFEGLPDYISLKVSFIETLPRFDVFSNSHQTNIDSLFVEEIKSDKGKYILSFIGSKGLIPELFSNDRILYAPAFYHGSSSFVKYIADHYDIKILITGISSFRQEQQTIEKLAGKPLEILKKEWLDKLKIAK